jgi:DNA-binding ferritin-like protein
MKPNKEQKKQIKIICAPLKTELEKMIESHAASMVTQYDEIIKNQHELIKEASMSLDHGTYDERLATLDKLDKYLYKK